MISFNSHGNSEVSSDCLHFSRSRKVEIKELKFKPRPLTLEPRCYHSSMLPQGRALEGLRIPFLPLPSAAQDPPSPGAHHIGPV